MNDQEQLAEDLGDAIDRLQGLSVPDPDQDDLVTEATELLQRARDLATSRA